MFVERVTMGRPANLRHSSPGVLLKSTPAKGILKSAGKFSKAKVISSNLPVVSKSTGNLLGLFYIS